MKQVILQLGLFALMAAAVHTPLHAQVMDRQARIEAHQQRIQNIITESRARLTSDSKVLEEDTTTGPLVSIVASNLPLDRVISQLAEQAKMHVNSRGNVGNTKVSTIFPNPVPLARVLNHIAETNHLQVRRIKNGYEIWDPLEYQRQAQEVQVYTIKEAKADDIAALVQPMLTYKSGSVKSYPAQNALIVYDVPEKQQAVVELLEKLDKKLFTRIFTIEHARPQMISQQLAEFCDLPRGQIIMDEASRQVVVRGNMGTLVLAESLVTALDVPPVPAKE